MGAIQLRDELQRAIEGQVAMGRFVSAEAFLEEAVERMLDEAEMYASIDAGIADADAGRVITIATPEDAERYHALLMEQLRGDLIGGASA